MIENFLEFKIWQQIIMAFLMIGGIIGWVGGLVLAIVKDKKKRKEQGVK